MPKFKYVARDKNGKDITATREAEDRYALARTLRGEGVLLLSVEELTGSDGQSSKKMESLQGLLNIFSRIKLAEKIIFSKNLGVMVGAGLPVTRALDSLANETKNLKFRATILGISGQIRQGKGLGESFSKYPKVFPPLYIAMLEAGEKSGKLRESLFLITSQMQADYDLARKVRGAMVYPGVILTAMVAIGVGMMIYVVPTLSNVFKELKVDLPPTTKFIIWLSDTFVANGFIIFLIAVAAIVGFFQFRKSVFGKNMLDSLFLKLPVIGELTKKFNSARTARTLASLISSGVQILEALDITSRVIQNHLYTAVLVGAKGSVQRGETMAKTFAEHQDLYPSLMSEMIAVGEETGQSSKMLEEVASFYEQQVSDATKDLSTIIEPILMLVIGAGVGFFAISMISPMYSLSDAL